MHWQQYRNLRNLVIEEIRISWLIISIKKGESQINKYIPPGKWWRIVKSLAKVNNKHKALPPLKTGDNIIFHPIDKANTLNKYFSDISSLCFEPELPEHGPGLPSMFSNTDEIPLDLVLSEE